MALYFRNFYGSRVHIAYLYPSSDCRGGYHKRGWVPLDPGQTKKLYPHHVGKAHANFYWYIWGEDGSEWSGEAPVSITNDGFRNCVHDPLDYEVGMGASYSAKENLTINIRG